MTTGTIQPHAVHAAWLDGANGEELPSVYRSQLQQLTVLPAVRLIDLPVFAAGAIPGGAFRRMPAARIGWIRLLAITTVLAVISDGWLLVDQVGDFLTAASRWMTAHPAFSNALQHAARRCPVHMIEAAPIAFIGWSLLVCAMQEAVLFIGQPDRLPCRVDRAGFGLAALAGGAIRLCSG